MRLHAKMLTSGRLHGKWCVHITPGAESPAKNICVNPLFIDNTTLRQYIGKLEPDGFAMWAGMIDNQAFAAAS